MGYNESMNQSVFSTLGKRAAATLLSPRLLPWISAMYALGLYVSSAAPWLTWANYGTDGGDLIAAAMTGGVPHPSGYPTYCLLARLFACLPLGTIARRFNLFSAVCAASAVALFSLCAAHVLEQASAGKEQARQRSAPGSNKYVSAGSSIVALGAAVAVASAPGLWSQATISEVYTLNALFCMALLYCALRRPTSTSAWGLYGALLGLGMGNHLTLVWLAPALVILLKPVATRRRVIGGLVGLLVGLSIYAYLPLAARSDPPINWGNPRTWQGFWWVVSGQAYHSYALSLPLSHLASRLAAWLRLAVEQYTVIGLALAMNGLWAWLEGGRRRWAWSTGLTWGLVTLYALLYDTADSYVYLIPAHLLTALWMAEGARSLYATLARTRLERAALPIAAGLLFMIAGWSVVRNMPSLDLSHDEEAQRWATEIEQALPADALVITGGDAHTFTLHYVRWVEKRRPDLIIVDGELLWQPWYVAQLPSHYPALSQGPYLTEEPHAETLQELIAANLANRPIYLTDRRESLEEHYRIEAKGPLLWVVKGTR